MQACEFVNFLDWSNWLKTHVSFVPIKPEGTKEETKNSSEEMESLKRGITRRTKSGILKLYQFLHNDVVHVGGRCANADMLDEAMSLR